MDSIVSLCSLYIYLINLAPFDPVLDNIPYCGLYNISATDTVKYEFVGQRARIYNFAPLVRGQRIYLGLFSISNPAVGSYNLQIAIRDSVGKVIE
jgi:hypothetical protein